MESENNKGSILSLNSPSPVHHMSQLSQSTKSKDFLQSFKRKNRHSLTDGFFDNPQLNLILAKSTKKPNFSKPILERSSIVYQLPHTGDMKFKDYDKISGDIRQLELTIKRENRQNSKRISEKKMTIMYKNDIHENDESEEKDSNEEDENNKNNDTSYIEKYNILEVIQKFKIPPENRTVEDLYITNLFNIYISII